MLCNPASACRPATRPIAVLLCAATWVMDGIPALSDPIKIFGVDVYVTQPPTCAPITRTFEVRAKVNPFEMEAQVSEIVTALASRVREGGGNVLHSIRVISAEPFQGAEAAGTGAVCQTPNVKPDLLAAVTVSRGADILSIRPRDPLGPNRTLENAEVSRLTTLSDTDLKKVKGLVAQSQQALSDLAILRSCPFIPNIGFRFEGNIRAWWLVSVGQGCDGAVLMSADDDWRHERAAPLTEAAMSEILRIRRR